jgi:hypothetical protein
LQAYQPLNIVWLSSCVTLMKQRRVKRMRRYFQGHRLRQMKRYKHYT